MGTATVGEDNFSGASFGASSGDIFGSDTEKFPKLTELVARAIDLPPGARLPASLQGAIAQYPERVLEAIDYLNYQRQRRHIHNLVGYLYEAIVSKWDLSIPKSAMSVPPAEFKRWFDEAKAQGQVLAAMMIDGVHHTLHAKRGWVLTEELM